jgi:methyl-accepting chemotaxis protein
MGLRAKILIGFLILSSMLLIAGAWSIYELGTIGSSVQKLLDDNYKSINAAKMMMEALEREDSATLLLLLGNWDEGRKIMAEADSMFQQSLQTAQTNITEQDEAATIELIWLTYDAYQGLLKKPIVGTTREGNLNWYFQKVQTAFLDVRGAVEKLMALNDQAMYETASDLKNRANRAIMPGIVAIAAAVLFSVMFNYFVNYYMVSPLIKITRGIEEFAKSGKSFDVRVETNDEIADLASTVSALSSQVRAGEKEQ